MSPFFANRLTEHLQTLAPIAGVRLPALNNRTTWEIVFQPEATAQQRQAAQAALLTYQEPVKTRTLTGDDVLSLLKEKGLITDADIARVRQDNAAR